MLRLPLQLLDHLRHQRRKRMEIATAAGGRRGEDLAHRYLQQHGFVIVARNYRTPSGSSELDLIAWEGDQVVFVEVKSRASGEYGPPERAVGEEKRRRLFRGARDYLLRSGAGWSQARFDLVSIVLSDPPHITHFRDVFPVETAV